MKGNSKAMTKHGQVISVKRGKRGSFLVNLRLPKIAASNLFQTDKGLVSSQSIVR